MNRVLIILLAVIVLWLSGLTWSTYSSSPTSNARPSVNGKLVEVLCKDALDRRNSFVQDVVAWRADSSMKEWAGQMWTAAEKDIIKYCSP